MSGPMSSLNKSRRVPFKASSPGNTSDKAANRSSATDAASGAASKRSSPRLPPMSPLSPESVDIAGDTGDQLHQLPDDDDSELVRLANEVLDDEVLRRLRLDRQKQEQQQQQQQKHRAPLPVPSRFRQQRETTMGSRGSDRPPSARAGIGNSSTTNSSHTDAALLASAVSRVAALERLCKEQREEISRRQRRIDVLEDKVRLLTTASAAANGGSREVDSLRSRCRELQKQVHEMENFLADYGLIWVGEEDDGDSGDEAWGWDPDRFWRPEESTAEDSSGAGIEIGPSFFNRFLECIVELNRLFGEDELKVTKTDTGATLARQSESSIPLCIYANGLALWDGPFRSYSEPNTRQFVADILDGYFPAELQARYPDGVAFLVTDRREVQFDASLPAGAARFAGQGRVLGGVVDDDQKRKQFLSRLPASVVARSGQVVDIRQSVAQTLQGSQPSRQQSTVLIDAAGDTPVDRVASVKIRASNLGDSGGIGGTFMIRLPFDATIDTLFHLLRDRGALKSADEFALVNAYPRSTLKEGDKATANATVEQSGLAPNATLMLVKQKPK